MTTTQIPDILADLKNGQYGYDFVRALAGDLDSNDRAAHYALQHLLDAGKVDALVNMILIGTRSVLNSYAGLEPGKQTAACARLTEMTPHQREDAAISPADFLGRS